MTDELLQTGRLCFRHEDVMWNAYYAMPDTLEGAVLLGSIPMASVQREDRMKQFMDLMRECVGDYIEDALGIRPTWGEPTRGPEHERTHTA